MISLSQLIARTVNYISTIGISDVVDILLVTFLIYKAILLIRRTNAKNLAKALLFILVLLGLSSLLNLNMINFIIRKSMEIGLVALVVLFQPELRHMLDKLGNSLTTGGRVIGEDQISSAIGQTVFACRDMSASKTGALIIFERNTKLNEIIETGTKIDAEVSAELLKNLFYNKAPLHDGAVIIRNGRIAAAGCVLPLTKRSNLSKDLGMRHRAGIGLSEESDALVLIVSEETGYISCAIDGMLKRHLKESTVDRLLRSEILKEEEKEQKTGYLVKLVRKLLNTEILPAEGKEEGDEKAD